MTKTAYQLDAGYRRALLDRFLRYVRVDTRSDDAAEAFPSTPGQWDLLRMLEKEMKDLGLTEITLDEHGYLFGTLPANLPAGREAPVIGWLAHVDTYPGTSGKDVKPQVIEAYKGGDLPLPGDPSQVLRAAENPELARCVGHTLVTSDGTTLLGADDKAGIAAILTACDWLLHHPEVKHGKLRVGFTPDEEVGRGTLHFDIPRFGAKAAYTFDGSLLGEIENETFNADSAIVTLTGFDCHPGKAKGVMINALRAAGVLLARLPQDRLPETTDGRQSFVHPIAVQGDTAKAVVRFIVRAFTMDELHEREDDIRRVVKQVESAFPGLRAEVEIKESYRNMRQVLDQQPEIAQLAIEAVRRAGMEPILSSIRGGTDGSALSLKGLPTPNVFAGGVNFHGVQEWVSMDWMAKSVETALHLAELWGERAK